MEDDLKLVQEVLNGNTDSFNIIVNKYELPVLKFIYNMVKNKETAEDITQEVFITLYNKLYMYKDEYKFSNWVFQIAKNKSIDYMRKYKRVHESNIEEVKDIASKEVGPEETAQFQETKKNIEAFINSLEEIDRQIILLRYSREEMTFLDISQILNISESSVKRRYYKARDKYKQHSLNNEKRCRI